MTLYTQRLNRMANRPEGWKLQAACRAPGIDPELFFVDQHDPALEAKAICAGCPVRLQCLDYALTAGERHGIWGGSGERERRRIKRQRERAAS
jgi:WhiB family redox-sensing transcriptional regulator